MFKTIKIGHKSVPELIFGSLTMAPLQLNLTIEEGAAIVRAGLEKGIRWIDTAQMYGSYGQVQSGIEKAGFDREELVISTKSTAKTGIEMKQAINQALEALKTSYIDIFLLHAVRTEEDYASRQGALKALLEAKQEGIVKYAGVSTHSHACARAICNDERLDWYHLIFNYKGIGLLDGTVEDQEKVMFKIKERGASIYAMKPLGGGYLKNEAEKALNWLRKHALVDAIALGMASLEEVEMNSNIFQGLKTAPGIREKLKKIKKKLFVFAALCTGCAACVKACEQKALTLEQKKAHVNPEKCILCGYCVPVCPCFAMRII